MIEESILLHDKINEYNYEELILEKGKNRSVDLLLCTVRLYKKSDSFLSKQLSKPFISREKLKSMRNSAGNLLKLFDQVVCFMYRVSERPSYPFSDEAFTVTCQTIVWFYKAVYPALRSFIESQIVLGHLDPLNFNEENILNRLVSVSLTGQQFSSNRAMELVDCYIGVNDF